MKLAYALLGAVVALIMNHVYSRPHAPANVVRRRMHMHHPDSHSAEAELNGPVSSV